MDTRPNSLHARDVAYSLHPFCNLSEHREKGPLVIERGEGVYVYDDAGKAYLDTGAGLWSVSLGYGEMRLVEAAARQMEKLPYYHAFRNRAHEPGIALAEKLIEMLPVRMSKVFFTNSGSEANDTAVKMTWYYNNALGRPEKKKIIGLTQAYHGVTVVAASLGGIARNHLDFDLPLANFLHTDCPHHYRYGRPGESEGSFADRLAANLEALIEREGPETVAAFIAEPVLGAGGVIVPPRGYFQKIQPILKKHDILFIADEVICGFCRTGNTFGSQTFDLKPDIVTMAKALSASYQPIAAVAVSEAMYDAFVDESDKIGMFAHGFTYSGHPVCAAVALEALKIYKERDVLGHVRRVAPRFQAGLRRLADHPFVGEVRGVGLMAALEFVEDKRSKQPFDPGRKVGRAFVAKAEELGLLTRDIGDAIALSPPLIISEAELDDLLARFEKALEATETAIAKG